MRCGIDIVIRPCRTSSSTVERGILEHGLTADERADHPGLSDGTRTSIEEVAIEDRDIGELADLERAGFAVEMIHVRGTIGERGESIDQVKPLLGKERYDD